MYEGQWSTEGKRQGRGRLKLSNGDQYYGEFMNGFFHGLGVLNVANGSKYEGSFELGRYHGFGVYTTTEKTKYEVNVVKRLGLSDWIQTLICK